MDTIFATSTGAPPAAIAIIRLSGPDAAAAALSLAGSLPTDRVAGVRALRARDGHLLDRALVLSFPGRRTATGEDVVELHVHGGRAVVAAVESELASVSGLRRAEPGEFTRRALLNGVIDLTEAEGLGDLLAAETEGQRRAALRIAEGGLRVMVEHWTTALVTLAAQIEAQLDFSDEDDVTATASGLEPVREQVITIAGEVAAVLAQPSVERLRDGLRVVLAGPPNSGKSTLLNALAERDVAIVSAIAGTTRDRIEAAVVRNGIAYILTDTAGLAESTDDPIERIGIARARAAMAEADLVVWLGDDAPQSSAIWIGSRSDVPGRESIPGPSLAVSAVTRAGLADLWALIDKRGADLLPADMALATNTRQRGLLDVVVKDLDAIRKVVDPLIVAEHVRLALASLDAITGKAAVEDVLDALFARFCIGK